MESVVLTENEVESLVNGIPIQKKLADGNRLLIRQSYMKDATAPIINHDRKIYSNAEVENIKIVSSMISDTFKLGV